MMKRHVMRRLFLFVLSLGLIQAAFATEFNLPQGNNALIGEIQYKSAGYGETTGTVAQHYDLGINAMLSANPGLTGDTAFTSAYLKLPTQFLLPPLPRKGLVINLPEMRIYYYLDNEKVMTFPVGIGKFGKTIPLRMTKVVRKAVNPTWTPTESIREFNREQGIELPHSMGPGPDNPLGPLAIYTGIPTYLIHSTIYPESVGRRASFGCIRMNEGDMKAFYPVVSPGVPIAIVDMPVKIGWNDAKLYMEAHDPLEESNNGGLSNVVDQIQDQIPHGQLVLVDWQVVSYLSGQPDGVPHEIGFAVN